MEWQSEYRRRKCDDLLTLRPVFVPTPNVTAVAPPPAQLKPSGMISSIRFSTPNDIWCWMGAYL
jgi:hypothetical protein